VWGHGFCLNDCLTRVPLVLRHPRYWPPGTRFKGLVQLHDLHDLFVSVAASGEPRPEEYTHCLTQANDATWPGREVVFSEFPRQTKTLEFMRNRNPHFEPGIWDKDMWGVRSMDWRYIEYGEDTCELYNLNDDPDETVSVHSDHPEVCTALHESLRAQKDDKPYTHNSVETPEENDAVILERLRALGYIE